MTLITLTKYDGATVRVNADLIVSFSADFQGHTRLRVGADVFLVKQKPAEIDALIAPGKVTK